jgi:hypothetical protein
MLETRKPFKAQAYRRKASTCDSLAGCARTTIDRDQLQHMRDAWLSRAANQDWLDGLPPQPPEGANALAVPSRA